MRGRGALVGRPKSVETQGLSAWEMAIGSNQAMVWRKDPVGELHDPLGEKLEKVWKADTRQRWDCLGPWEFS